MTVDQLVAHLAHSRRLIKILRDDNRRLWNSREEWKRKHREAMVENTALRKKITRLTESRDLWRSRAPKRWTRSGTPAVQLRPGDLERILEMPARD